MLILQAEMPNTVYFRPFKHVLEKQTEVMVYSDLELTYTFVK